VLKYKNTLFFLLIIFAFSFPCKSIANTLAFFLDDFKPIAYREDGIYKGVLVEWVKLIANELNIEYSIALVPTARIYQSFNENGSLHASILALTPQLSKVTSAIVNLPSYPVAILTLKENPILSLNDLHDKTVCQVRGTTYGLKYDNASEILKYNVLTYTQIIKMVSKKRCFAGIGVLGGLENIIEHLDYPLSSFSQPFVIYELPLTLVMPKNSFDADFTSRIKNAVLKLKNTLEFKKIVNQYKINKTNE
jgi:polar amino acid transport system substrate-binding protein